MLTNTFTAMAPGDAVYVDPGICVRSGQAMTANMIYKYCATGVTMFIKTDLERARVKRTFTSIAHMKYLNKRFIVISIPNQWEAQR